MKFSVIIPAYNCADKIEKTMKSVLRQKLDSQTSFELIIIDGASLDGTQSCIESIIAKQSDNVKCNITFLSEEDQGIYDAMNKGLKIATGDYVLFLGAGDWIWDDKTLLKLARAIELTNKPDILYGYVHTKVDGINQIMDRKVDFNYTFRFLPVCHQAVVAKRSLFAEKNFDIKYKAVADQDWIMYMVKCKKHFAHVNIPIAFYEEEGFSCGSEQVISKAQNDLDAIHLKYFGFRRRLYLFCKKVKHILVGIMR